MTKVAIIGKGNWGTKIQKCLEKLPVELVETTNCDWVVLSTPNDLHYEQCVYWISKGKNVFCEKPLSLNHQCANSVYQYADQMGVKFYVDDVFSYRDIDVNYERNIFEWNKPNITSYLERLAYHHFYLWLDQDYPHIKEMDFTKNALRITLESGRSAYFIYEEAETYHAINGVEVETNVDALPNMLDKVFKEEVDWGENKKRTLGATLLLEQARKLCYKKALVIGGGIFGCTSAITLSNNGYTVDLLEKENDLMKGASSINQYRLHKGYHYPRSKNTAKECIEGIRQFERKYEPCVVKSPIKHLYGIAEKDSLINADQYKSFLHDMNLSFEEQRPLPGCQLTISANERLFNPSMLRYIVSEKLYASGVDIHLKTEVKDLNEYKSDYDVIVIATYSMLNQLLTKKKEYQFEVCEKPVVKLPKVFHNKSIVIMDGPFACLDPYEFEGQFVLGNVVHAIHETNVGTEPIVNDKKLRSYLNRGLIRNPEITNIDKFIESGKTFFGEEFADLEHVGSMYTIRTVLKNRDHDDARPTLVAHEEDNVYSIFSGKIDTCVSAANELVEMIKDV